ncbi:MAG: hypothetical protein HZB16_07305 [Armatimonadetes bacterium]|nr:hypothetical protein [Armatimonadota bacterium]
MAKTYVCVWYDTEDFVHPASDDAALRIAGLHERHGVRATFKVVGEKARVLADRGRADVIDALARHDIGYHTDFHSAHPVVTEYCEVLSWHQGEELFRARETAGLHDVERIFGQSACTFGQAGAAWAPQMYPVLRDWGIPTYVDDGPWVGLDDRPFWFMGLLHVFRLGRAPRFDPATPGSELDALTRLRDHVRRVQADGGGVVSIYYHPCEWSTDAFWDAVNFAAGRNPATLWLSDSVRPRLVYNPQLPPVPSPAELARRFEALDCWLRGVSRTDAVSIGCSDLPDLYPDRAVRRYYGLDELVEATAEWVDTVSYARVSRGWLSAGELLMAAVRLLAPCDLPPAKAPRLGRALSVDGPHRAGPRLSEPVSVAADSLLEAAGWLCRRCAPAGEPGRERAARALPAAVPVANQPIAPEEFLMGLLRLLRGVSATGHLPAGVELSPTELAPATHIRGGPECFHWPCFAPGFDAPHVIAHARRQAWTLKPALLAPGAVRLP